MAERRRAVPPARLPTDRLWKVNDVATFLRVADGTISHWISAGVLDEIIIHLGRAVRFHPDDVRGRFIDQHRGSRGKRR